MLTRRGAFLGTAGLALASRLPGVAQAQAPAPAPALAYRPHSVTTPDGVVLSVQEWGNPQGPAILFIHGSWQSHLSWARQVSDPALAARYRMVTFDLRGHGDSAKPEGDAFYKPAKPWADDVAAIIAALGLQRPVLAGWSYGGRVMCDYLTVHGADRIGGLHFVDATTTLADPAAFFGPGLRTLAAGTAADQAQRIAGTIAFLRVCFERQPTDAEFQAMLAFNMLTPRHVRIAMGGRPAQYEAMLRALRMPTLVTHGEKDQIILPALARWTASVVPGARLSIHEGAGHSPFWEDTPRFNRELAELMAQVAARRG
ncbi:alpha/beta fold hydrolase [Roseomonas sp. CECT 9278]|uniref:alpha/beta fold hydrolase n=1 Tax=Roseomonas sp. CECT 9278 TaxID=2845823 RepID=UPI001E3D321A|nr:alpha/beta hydrolase [Roseomonas sp. CECT 9278]CAH0310213.1 AB hydrolase superfamily protein YdjP [Roseomonas sp. CECT 9278]